MTFVESAENLKEAWAKLLQAIDEELHIKEKVQKTYKYEWETPPKYEPTVNTNCVNVIASRLECEPQTEEYCDRCNHKGCDNCVADASNPHCVPSNYKPKDEPQTADVCTWDGKVGEIKIHEQTERSK